MWRRTHSTHRLVALLLLATYSLSCALGTWKPQEAPPDQVLTAKSPDHVRLITASGTKLELWNPRISNDSLVGDLKQVAAGETGPTGGLPLTEIATLEVRGTDTGRLVAGIGLSVLLVAAIIAWRSSDIIDVGPTRLPIITGDLTRAVRALDAW